MQTSKRTIWLAVAAAALWIGLETSAAAMSGDLQGLNKQDSTNWSAASSWSGNNLRGWRELDMVPCRVLLQGPASNSPVSISFPRTRNGLAGFEDLFFMSNSPNVIVKQPPVLSGPTTAGEWTYSFNVTMTGAEQGYIYFQARLAAGAHFNPGSSLHLCGEPGLSPLQIHKPGAALSKPDLGVTITGPETALPGETLVYTINYTNRAVGPNDIAHGVVVTATLPAFAEYVAGSATSGGSLHGNVLIWNPGDLGAQAGGSLSYQVIVAPTVPLGAILTHHASIAGAENDLVLADNTSSASTSVAAASPEQSGGALRITRITKFDEEIYHVYFQTAAGHNYSIQHTEDFIEWTIDSTVIPGTGTEVASRQRQGGAMRFYRVMELP